MDRLQKHRVHSEFDDADRALIESAAFFFLATASEENVDFSFKGGTPCFVKVTGSKTLELPDYDGNRMYRSLGNIGHNPLVGILFSVSMGTSTTVIWRDCGSMGVPRSMTRLMRSNTCQAPDALYRFALSIFFQTARATFKQWN